MGKRYFSNKIVKWYLDHFRPLPWRDTKDPYRIWLSEVILQQTRVAQGLPYYLRFVEAFPTVTHLANASEQKVLRLWQGLGYYTRARNLHKCAKTVVRLHGGKFPEHPAELEKLPGIGHYTAAAIASLAFGVPAAVLDGNVYRVLSRIFGIETAINGPQSKKVFGDLASQLVPATDPGTHNQAVMEFGALFCTPKTPRCTDCPFRTSCIAYSRGLVSLLPVKTPKKKSRKRYFFYLVVEKQNALLMKRREAGDIWHGLFDFVLIEKTRPVKPELIMAEEEHRGWFRTAEAVSVSKVYKHILTHQIIHCRFIHIKTKRGFRVADQAHAFYSAAQVAELPKPVLITRFLKEQNAQLVAGNLVPLYPI